MLAILHILQKTMTKIATACITITCSRQENKLTDQHMCKTITLFSCVLQFHHSTLKFLVKFNIYVNPKYRRLVDPIESSMKHLSGIFSYVTFLCSTLGPLPFLGKRSAFGSLQICLKVHFQTVCELERQAFAHIGFILLWKHCER